MFNLKSNNAGPASTSRSIVFYGSLILAFAGWFIFWISLAVGQNDLSGYYDDSYDDYYGDLIYSYVNTSQVYSYSWWAFAFQFLLLMLVSFYPCLSNSFHDSLFTVLTLYSLNLFTAILSSYVFNTGSYMSGVVAGAIIIAVVDFYWIFYFSTLPSNTAAALFIFPPKPVAEKTVDIEAVQEPVVPAAEPVAVEPVPVAPVAPAAPVAAV